MKTITPVSGGKSSAYVAANYKSDALIFSLVRTMDKNLQFPDKQLRKVVSDKINAEFVGTLEQDDIIYTMLDLEQYLGKKVNWVTGLPFEKIIVNRGGYLPNIATRYCTTELKMRPIVHWWYENYKTPVEMPIGYRFTERSRKTKMVNKLNNKGLHEFEITLEKHEKGRHKGNNKWVTVEWRVPTFPLIEDVIYRDEINSFWDGKPVRFAELNNCIGCFHRGAALLNYMSKIEPEKFNWFIEQENMREGFFKKEVSYEKARDSKFSERIDFDAKKCDSGFCGM